MYCRKVKMRFEFAIIETFKLSTGATAFVGYMRPHNYPIITLDKYVAAIVDDEGNILKPIKVSEDIFSRADPKKVNNLRSIQTFDQVDELVKNVNLKLIKIIGRDKVDIQEK